MHVRGECGCQDMYPSLLPHIKKTTARLIGRFHEHKWEGGRCESNVAFASEIAQETGANVVFMWIRATLKMTPASVPYSCIARSLRCRHCRVVSFVHRSWMDILNNVFSSAAAWFHIRGYVNSQSSEHPRLNRTAWRLGLWCARCSLIFEVTVDRNVT
jgi:hypothetical protein